MAESMRYATGCHDLDEEIFSLRARAEKAEQENARLREALAELVRLKDVKDLSDLVVSEQDRAAMLHFYEIDKPKAWAAARTALGGEE